METAASTGSMYYDESWPDNIVLLRAYGSLRCPQTGKRTTGPFSPPLASSAKVWCSQPATRRRPRPSHPAGLRDAKAANTRRVYAPAWHEFNVWALANGRQSLPAEPQTVALYLGRLAADGRAMATIEQARAAISHAHAAEGTAKGDNPARHPVVAETVKGWRNQAPAPQQASALTAEALAS